jgi:hypothetical protein
MPAARRALLLLLPLLSACLPLRYPPPAGVPFAPAPGETLVLGSLLFHDGDREIHPFGADLHEALAEALGEVRVPRVNLGLLQVESGRKAPFPRVGGDGSFAWLLPPGSYLLYVARTAPHPSNEAVAAFRVPPGVAALRVGTVTLRLDTEGVTEREPDGYAVEAVTVDPGGGPPPEALPLLDVPVTEGRLVYDPSFGASPGLLQDYSRERAAAILRRHGIVIGE